MTWFLFRLVPVRAQTWVSAGVGFTFTDSATGRPPTQLCVQVATAPLPALGAGWRCGFQPYGDAANRMVMDAPSFAGEGVYFVRFLVDRSSSARQPQGAVAGPLGTLPGGFSFTAADLAEVGVEVRSYTHATAMRFAGPFTDRQTSPGKPLFDAVHGLVHDPAWRAAVRRSVDAHNDVFAVMVNAPLVPELLNALHVAGKFAGLRTVLAVCLDAECQASLRAAGLHPFNGAALCDGCDSYATYGSKQFGRVTSAKVIVCAAVVELGHRVWWMDSDVLLWRDPRQLPGLRNDPRRTVVRAAAANTTVWATARFDYTVDAALTYDGLLAWLAADTTGRAAADTLCSGFFFVAPTPGGRRFMDHVVHALGSARSKTVPGEWFWDDQAAFNAVVSTMQTLPALRGVVVIVLPAASFPNGGIYFNESATLRAQGHPLYMLHNNHITGFAAKRRRLEEHGMWYV